MKTPIVDGQSIDQFIPANLRGMFYKHPMPEYKYAIHDGYAPYGFSTDGLVLYLPLWALGDSSFKSVDAYKHTATVTTATWQPNGRDFNSATPDYIEIPATATQLDFTSEDFSFVIRIYFSTIGAKQTPLNKGIFTTGGYFIHVTAASSFQLYTNQVAATQKSGSVNGSISALTWYTLGISRSGASVKVYKNGVDFTALTEVHIDPVSTPEPFLIGIRDDKVTDPFDGIIQTILAYSRALSAGEHLDTHNKLSWRT